MGAYNATRLKLLGKPIYQIDAVHTKKSSKHLRADNFGGLESKLFVAKGARIMITRNLWPTAGLVNGATGTIIDLIYHPSAVVPDQPISIIVQFDNYSGPSVKEGKPGCVPICPLICSNETLGTQNDQRRQFPLTLAWAITIHKSQGLTLPMAWINIGEAERCAGLTFVALSRLIEIHNAIIEGKTFQRFQKIKNAPFFQLRQKEEKRLDQLASDTIEKYKHIVKDLPLDTIITKIKEDFNYLRRTPSSNETNLVKRDEELSQRTNISKSKKMGKII